MSISFISSKDRVFIESIGNRLCAHVFYTTFGPLVSSIGDRLCAHVFYTTFGPLVSLGPLHIKSIYYNLTSPQTQGRGLMKH